jgi:predicted nucleic acid-binding protein
MIYIVDTNILFSAYYNPDSRAGSLIDLAMNDRVELCSPEHIRLELLEVLNRKLHYVGDHLLEAVVSLPVRWVDRAVYDDGLGAAMKVVMDESDASLLALASIMGCEIVTGDEEVLRADFHDVKVRRLNEVTP